MRAMFDAIVVGARCAGSPTAMLLAQKGYRVLVIDKATFPSDTMSTLYLQAPAITRLHRWGLLDRIRASGCPPIKEWRMQLGGLALRGFPWSADGVTESLAPRRTVLDKILLDAAGAEVREGVAFEDLVRDGDQVCGVRARSASGGSFEERARIVIGADGMRSKVADAVGAEKLIEKPDITLAYYSFYSGVQAELMGVTVRTNRWTVTLPTNDGLALVYVGRPKSDFAWFKTDAEENFLTTLDEEWPEVGAACRAGKREDRLFGSADLQNFFRRSQGNGWALVGDAGYHKDPCTAQGISDALKGAESLATAIDDGFSGRRPIAEALSSYERTRNEAAMPIFDWTYRAAEMRAPSEKTQLLLAALNGNQEDTNRFLGLNAGTVLASEFFAQENLARIFGKAMA
jgi:2-polyprenyl-6-methoxyphenol hydroxylase-like FAD-dependent oxidoreductase